MVIHLDTVHRVAGRASREGAQRTSLMTMEWDVSGSCQSPVMRELFARPPADKGSRKVVVKPGKNGKPFRVILTVRCRRCDKCRKARSFMWYQRAIAETRVAPRTWFGTITLAPQWHTLMYTRACARLRKQGIDLDLEPYGVQFDARHQECSKELTKYLKRLRKNSGATFRYLLVCEQHRSGMPHYHVLLHESSPDARIKHRQLQADWSFGFTSWKLTSDPRTAAYVCKYLSKSSAARVRASTQYGNIEHLQCFNINHDLNVIGTPPVTVEKVDPLPTP